MADLFIGTQGWSYPSWVGPFYAPQTRPARFLEAYSKQFGTVELDATFYATPRDSTVAGWRTRTPAGFVFSGKFPKSITHDKQLVDCQEDARHFVETMQLLGEKLGPLLLQMPPSFAAEELPALSTFLNVLPQGVQVALEVRHPTWLKPDVLLRLTDVLLQHHVSLCLVQHAWMPHLDVVTAPFVYVRWLGRREDIPDDHYETVRINRDSQLSDWAAQIRRYLNQGLTVYGYFNNHYQGHSPSSVRNLLARIRGEST
jgi:uncharacterized protein YecE (DUF72 family)